MIRRIPVLPTLLVLLAVGVMIALGVWQLHRRAEKHMLLAHYSEAVHMSVPVEWPRTKAQAEASLYRHSRITCASVGVVTTKSGLNAKGEAGLAHYAFCYLPDGAAADVVLGWSRDPAPREWAGGEVTGMIGPGPRLVADPPLAGLDANAAPDPSEIPDNHLAYAVQWFLFAAVALVIYALALRKRLAAGAAQG